MPSGLELDIISDEELIVHASEPLRSMYVHANAQCIGDATQPATGIDPDLWSGTVVARTPQNRPILDGIARASEVSKSVTR